MDLRVMELILTGTLTPETLHLLETCSCSDLGYGLLYEGGSTQYMNSILCNKKKGTEARLTPAKYLYPC